MTMCIYASIGSDVIICIRIGPLGASCAVSNRFFLKQEQMHGVILFGSFPPNAYNSRRYQKIKILLFVDKNIHVLMFNNSI